MARQWLLLLLASLASLTLLLLVLTAAVSAQSKPAAFFVFGDSFADNGNWNASDPNQKLPWRRPYGITWPGRPAGRFSDGYVSTDFFAEFFRVGNSPPPYASVSDSTGSSFYKRGVDFAVGGAGIFPTIDSRTYGKQVDELKGFISQHPDIFSLYILQRSIVYVTYDGNDYEYQFFVNNGSTSTLTSELMSSVVQGIEQTIRSLYIVGFRNFLVTTVSPVECSPLLRVGGECNDFFTHLVSQHNHLLRASLDSVSFLPGAHIAVLDLSKTFSYVQKNARWFGFANSTGTCCTPSQPGGSCGDVDEQGKPLYQVCQNPASFFWWDEGHPTQAGWNAVTNLLNSGYNFTDFTPNLVYWFNNLNLTDVPSRNEGRVAREVDLALEAVNSTGQFSLFLDVVRRSNLLPSAPGVLSKTWRVTVFLPTDASIVRQLEGSPLGTFLQEIGLGVVSIHAVYGWWPAQRLLGLPSGSSLRTVAGTSLKFYNEAGRLILGAPSVEGGVPVVRTDIYVSSYTGVIHGIDGVLIPTYITPLLGHI